MKKFLCLLICVFMVLSLFAGCGASSEASDTATVEMNTMESADAAEEEIAVEESGWMTTASQSEAAEPTAESDMAVTDKIIYTADLSVETREFDKAVAALETMIAECGGYIQDSSVVGDTWYNEDGTTSVVNRYAWYTLAVPVESFEAFLKQTGEIGNVTSESRSADNITSQYTDTEARLASLEVQEERLLAMMEEATDIESLIALEERLSEVTYEIESYERTLQDWDRQVAYSTVTVNLCEVATYTQTASVTRSYGEQMKDALADGWTGFVRSTQNFTLWAAEAWPTLIILAVIVVVVLTATRKFRKNKKKTAPPEPAEEKKDETNE